MPSALTSLNKFLAALRGPPAPIKSFYLPATPRPKFPPRTYDYLTPEIVVEIVTNAALQTIFSTDTNGAQPDGTGNSLNAVLREMAHDRAHVIFRKISIKVEIEPAVVETFRVEYRFSDHLLKRIGDLLANYPGTKASPYNFVLDLVLQVVNNRNLLTVGFDEHAACWVRLRNAPPYREHAFYRDVTILLQHMGNLIDVVYGEIDNDIDTDYHFEWMRELVTKLYRGKLLQRP